MLNLDQGAALLTSLSPEDPEAPPQKVPRCLQAPNWIYCFITASSHRLKSKTRHLLGKFDTVHAGRIEFDQAQNRRLEEMLFIVRENCEELKVNPTRFFEVSSYSYPDEVGT